MYVGCSRCQDLVRFFALLRVLVPTMYVGCSKKLRFVLNGAFEVLVPTMYVGCSIGVEEKWNSPEAVLVPTMYVGCSFFFHRLPLAGGLF